MARKTDIETELKVCKLYNDGYGNIELCKLFGVTCGTISRILNRNNIKKYKGRKPSIKYDINFFSSYTPQSCYWAGFIYADGCITDKYGAYKVSLGIKSDDGYHLDKFSNIIKFYGHKYDDAHNNAKILTISGKYFVNDLKNKFGIVPKKSLTINFPQTIPSIYLNHFVRGIFDGDGSITFTKNNKGAISIIGNMSTILAIVDIAYYIIDIKVANYSNNTSGKPSIQNQGNVFSIRYQNRNAKKFLDWMYNNSDNTIRLDRKFLRYNEYFTEDRMADKRYIFQN